MFGDVSMHPKVPKAQVAHYLGDKAGTDVDLIQAWQQLSETWNVWFLRRPTGKPGDYVDFQWRQAIGEQKILRIQDEQRAVDYAMGIIARAWVTLMISRTICAPARMRVWLPWSASRSR